jgi:hypothetical protein
MYSIIISAMQAKKSAWTIWPRMGWDQGTCPKKPYLELLMMRRVSIGITNYKLRITNYELRITNYEFRIADWDE